MKLRKEVGSLCCSATVRETKARLSHCPDVISGWEGWQVDSPEPGDRSFQETSMKGTENKNEKDIDCNCCIVIYHL